MSIKASGTLKAVMNIQYLLSLVRGEVLGQFYMLSAEVGDAIPENLRSIILGVVTYFFLLM